MPTTEMGDTPQTMNDDAHSIVDDAQNDDQNDEPEHIRRFKELYPTEEWQQRFYQAVRR